MMNKIWAFFIIIGVVYSIVTGKIDLISTEIISCGETSLNMIFKIFPVMALWLGLMRIAEESGLLKKMSKLLSPVITKIFPEIPECHESISLIASNVVANMFGLGNAATPLGLKAMKSLQSLNQNKEEASHSMITFLVLNTTGFTLIPTTIISLKMMHGSTNPTEIVLPCFLASLSATIGGLIIDRIFFKRDKRCR